MSRVRRPARHLLAAPLLGAVLAAGAGPAGAQSAPPEAQPSPLAREVVAGRAPWLYYAPDLRGCTPEGRPPADPADAAEILARTLVASGRRAGVLVAGSKSVTHPQDLGATDPALLSCAAAQEARVQARLRRTPGGLDVQGALAARERRGQPTFLARDTHWSAAGRELAVRAMLDRIQPGLARRAGVRRGAVIARPSDLTRFLGAEVPDRDRVVVATGRPARGLRRGDVLLIGDSQLDFALVHPVGAPPIAPRILPGQPVCTWDDVDDGSCDAALRRARTVIVERVARNVRELVESCWRPVAVAAEGLRGRSGRWVAAGPRVTEAPRTLTIGPTGRVVAGVRGAGPDVAGVARLLRLPVVRLGAGAGPPGVALEQLPDGGPPVPCATPAARHALIVPVPAGRRASALVLALSAPPGTVLGAPEELVLGVRQASAPRTYLPPGPPIAYSSPLAEPMYSVPSPPSAG